MTCYSRSICGRFAWAFTLALLAEALCITRGSGADTFVPVPSFSPFPLRAAAVADLNHDGLPDAFAVPAGPFLRTGLGDIWAFPIHHGTGDGRLVATNSVTTGLIPEDLVPLRPVAGDFNGDGWSDVALVFYDTCAGHVLDPNPNCLTPSQTFLAVLLGQADGALNWTTNRPIGTYGGVPGGYFIDDWAGADLNHDGRTDLVFPASVLLGRGDGSFGEMLPLPAESRLGRTMKIRAADVTGDGHVDVIKAVRRYSAEGEDLKELQIYPGRGDGTFSSPQTVPLRADNADDISVADLNQDGVADLVCLVYPDGRQDEIQVVLGGSLASTGRPLAAGIGGTSVACVDLNDDGAPEAVVWAWGVRGSETWGSVLWNDGKGGLSEPEPQYFGAAAGDTGSGALAAGDFNADGRQDLLLISESAPYVVAMLNRPVDVVMTIDGEKALVAGSISPLTVTVRNLGGATAGADGVRVWVNLPPNLKFVSGSGEGWSWAEADGQVRGFGPRLGSGAQARASFQVQVGVERVAGIRVDGSVSVVGEVDRSNNGATFDADFLGYDLAVAVRTESEPWMVGTAATMEWIARNVGDLLIDPGAGGLFVSGELPLGVVFLGGAGCEAVGRTVACRLERPLEPGAEVRIPLRVLPSFAAYPSLEVGVEGHWSLDGTPGNNRASMSVPTIVEAAAAMAELQRIFDEVATRVLGLDTLAEHLSQARANLAVGRVEAAVRDLGKFRVAITASDLGAKDAATLDLGGRLTVEALRIPAVRIEPVGPGRVRVWWTGPPGMALETSVKFGSAAEWLTMETDPGLSAVEVAAGGSRAFFRLKSR